MMSEQVYDSEVAPLLQQLRDLCEKHEMPFIAAVQFSKQEWAHSVSMPNDGTVLANLRTMYYFAKTRNADASIGLMMQDAKKYGHSSAFIKMLDRLTA